MDLLIEDLVSQSGVAARTIREWIRLGMLPRPQGAGPAAVYTREHLLRLWVISANRRQGVLLEDIKAVLDGMSPREMARFKPKGPAPTEPAPSPSQAAPAPKEAAPPAPEHAAPPKLEAGPSDDARLGPTRAALPGRLYAVVPLLPGLILMVDEQAPSIVQRAAREIVERYGAGGA
jgi:DNA-binding transcriptional MerR regulator